MCGRSLILDSMHEEDVLLRSPASIVRVTAGEQGAVKEAVSGSSYSGTQRNRLY